MSAVKFTGWLLDERERSALIARLPPRYARTVAHHVTLKVRDDACPTPVETAGEIVGRADDGRGVEAMVVAIGGTTDRPDGSTYHVTWSLADGRQAKDSNEVIARGGWTPFAAPIPIKLIPKPYG